MTEQLLNKDQSIHDLLTKLRERFGEDSFDIVDHWEADWFAVGIARRDNHKILIYVSTRKLPDSGYYVESEVPPSADEDSAYHRVDRQEGMSFEEAANFIAEHLSLKGSLME